MIEMEKVLQKAVRDGRHKIEFDWGDGIVLNDKQQRLFEDALKKRALADYAAAELNSKRQKEAQQKRIEKDTADAIRKILGGYAAEKGNMRKKFAVQGFFDICNIAGDEFRKLYIEVGSTELLGQQMLGAATLRTVNGQVLIQIDISRVKAALEQVLSERKGAVDRLQEHFDDELKKWKEIDMEYVREMMLGNK